MACENCNPKVQLVKGVAYKIVNGKKVDVLSIDAPSCDCGFDTCDCAIRMVDLVTGDDYVLYIANGAITTVTKAEFDAMKEANNFDA